MDFVFFLLLLDFLLLNYYGKWVFTIRAFDLMIERAIFCLESNLYALLLGFRYGLQIDADIQRMQVAIESLSRSAKNPLSRTHIAVLKGVLSTYENQEVGTIILKSFAPNRMVDIFEAWS